MSIRMLESGIAAIQAGNKAEGARFLRIALKQGELTGALAATAYLWLAEATDDRAQKRRYYNDALNVDPGNPHAASRLASALAAQLPAGPPAETGAADVAPSQGSAPHAAASSPPDQIVAVIGGPNGPGTGFYVHPSGLLATTRYVVGGLERVTIEMSGQRQTLAQVVRSWPEYDLTLIRVDQPVPDTLPITPYPTVPDDTPLRAVAAGGQQMRGKQRPSKRAMPPHWFTTDFLKLPDAGGNPLFDPQGYLVGMLTKNSSRAASYLFGVHIGAIRRCAGALLQELNSERRSYCPSCGILSRATGAGYFYCEVCGSVTSQARQLHRFPQGDPFNESSHVACPHCRAQVGAYGGRCLRCGQGLAQ